MFQRPITQSTVSLGQRRPSSGRRGAAAIETVVTIIIFLTMILGLVDFGLLMLRQHVLAQAARQLNRQAIVHGSLSSELGSWGIAPVNVNASDSGPIATIVRTNLIAIDPSIVNIEVTWPGGSNDPRFRDPVNVTLTAPVQLLLTSLFGNQTYTLTASSSMQVAH